MGSGYFAVQISLFGSGDTALAFNAVLTGAYSSKAAGGHTFVFFEDEGVFLTWVRCINVNSEVL